MRFGILFDMFLDPSFKINKSVANITKTATSISKFIY